MSIFEFDEEREWKLIRKAEYSYGVEDGEKNLLKRQIEKKLQKGYSTAQIAEALEQDESTILALIKELESPPEEEDPFDW